MTILKIGTLLTKKPGHTIPVELLAAIINRRPTAFGAVVQDHESTELSVIHEASTPTMAQLEEFQQNAKDYQAMLYFGELGSKFNPEDIQPFVITDGDGKPFMAIGLEGDFPKHSQPNLGRTDDYNLASEIIIPTILEVCELGGEIEKIMSALNDDRFNKKFLEHVAHRGALTILPIEGDPLWLGKNELGNAYDWGQTSNRHGFDDVKQEPVKAEAPKKKFSFGAIGKKQEASPPALPKDVATKGADGPRTSVPEVRSDGKSLPQPVKCPDWIHKNEDKRSWYNMVAGQIPDRWKNKVPVIPVISEDKLPKDLGDLKMWEAEQYKKNLKGGTAVVNREAVGPVKSETSAGAPKTGAEIAAQRREDDEAKAIIGAKDMEKILNVVAGFKPEDMMSVKAMADLEKKVGDFSAQVGVTPQEMLNWPLSGLFAIARTDYRAIVLAFVEMRKLWRDTLDVKDLAGSTTTETKIGETGKKVESVSNAPPVEKKSKGFSFGKKAA